MDKDGIIVPNAARTNLFNICLNGLDYNEEALILHSGFKAEYEHSASGLKVALFFYEYEDGIIEKTLKKFINLTGTNNYVYLQQYNTKNVISHIVNLGYIQADWKLSSYFDWGVAGTINQNTVIRTLKLEWSHGGS